MIEHEQYYRKGGTYELPIEIYNDLIGQIDEKDKEIERLNNIINELEKYIDDNYFYDDVGMKIFDVSLLEDKIKELKESGNNE